MKIRSKLFLNKCLYLTYTYLFSRTTVIFLKRTVKNGHNVAFSGFLARRSLANLLAVFNQRYGLFNFIGIRFNRVGCHCDLILGFFPVSLFNRFADTG